MFTFYDENVRIKQSEHASKYNNIVYINILSIKNVLDVHSSLFIRLDFLLFAGSRPSGIAPVSIRSVF